ncbi:hypothetical protein TWF718_009640 [Orbilia javanica]|uniref:Zn(2)-C6 fungal-type domain-containing protein n=1 Tax=Orbilia javanica TaxID=47235 RepID=A0AAN8RBM1_9PEZI
MVFPGKLSTGCFCCRKRKIKCDEGRPNCRRCVIAGIECPGYREGFVIRSENFRAQQRVLRASQKSARQSLTESKTANSIDSPPSEKLNCSQIQPRSPIRPSRSPSTTLRPLSATASTQLYASVPTPWENVALAFFIDQHVLKSRLCPLGTGHLEFLPDLYNAVADTSCLKSAVLATAYLSFFNHTGSPCLDIMARSARSCALRTVYTALQSPDSAAKDETLVAIMLLSLFDDIDGDRTSITNPHIQGILHLLRLRAKKPLRSEQDRSLFGWAFTQMQIYSFTTAEYKCFDLNWFPGSIEKNDYGSHFALLSSKISYFCEMAQKSPPCNPENISVAGPNFDLSTIVGATDIQFELQSWMESLPNDWISREVPNITKDCITETRFLPIYASHNLACAWALFHSTVVIFNSSLINYCDRVLSYDPILITDGERELVKKTATTAEINIRNLLSRICESLPFIVGDIDENGTKPASAKYKSGCGYLLLWPLAVVANCRYSTAAQVCLSTKTLRRIGSSMKLANWVSQKPNNICFPGSRSAFPPRVS